jgi:hypothetical protein
MKETDILTSSSMPIASPSYPKGPYRFIDREFMIITYESDPNAIRDALPEPLEPDGSNTVLYEFIKMPDSAGFGDYTESGVVIPALYKGEHVNFTAQMYLDDEPPISGGREIWGFPKKLGNPQLEVIHDTLTGRLYYADVLVAVGTMSYKHEDIMCDVSNHYNLRPPHDCRENLGDSSQSETNSRHRRLDRYRSAGRLQSHRHTCERRMERKCAIATACACKCAGSRLAGQENSPRPSFHR